MELSVIKIKQLENYQVNGRHPIDTIQITYDEIGDFKLDVYGYDGNLMADHISNEDIENDDYPLWIDELLPFIGINIWKNENNRKQ